MADESMFGPLSRMVAVGKAMKYYFIHLFRYPKAKDIRLDNSHF